MDIAITVLVVMIAAGAFIAGAGWIVGGMLGGDWAAAAIGVVIGAAGALVLLVLPRGKRDQSDSA